MGWHRVEIMGAFMSILLIWILTGIIFYLAIQRIISLEFEIHPLTMLITASTAVVINIILGCILHDFGHGHSHNNGQTHGHSHGHGHSHELNKKDEKDAILKDCEDASLNNNSSRNMNVRAAFIHVLGDFIHSLGILTAAITIFVRPEWKIVDPICTIFFSVMVITTTMRIIKDIVSIFMEARPSSISYEE